MSDTVIISVDRDLDPIKQKNFLITIFAISFIWMLFHFAVVFFFTLQLWSIAMVWVFLWLWNLFAFLMDIPIWILQSYFKSKTLFIFSCIFQIIVFLIFSNFIFEVTNFLWWSVNDMVNGYISDEWNAKSVLTFFLVDGVNLLLLLLAAVFYWVIKELQEVTTISYILNNATPSQYASLFAKKNISVWIWSFMWLLLAWIILTFNPKLIIIAVLIIIFVIIFLTSKFFDNSDTTIDLKDINKFRLFLDKDNFSKDSIISATKDFKNHVVKTINKIELKEVIKNTRYVFMKPFKMKTWLKISTLVDETKKDFSMMFQVLVKWNNTLLIYWSTIMLLTFWFWDTFAATFLIQFLDWLLKWWSYILLWIIAIPAFLLQDFFSKLALKYWEYKIANLWLFLSWASLFLMWVFSSYWLWVVLPLWIINSIWYASCMVLSQSLFLVSYNKSYADYAKLKDIDANAASAPMKILQNLANVVWLFFWWIILAMLNYMWFFIVFGLFIVWILVWSLKNKLKIKS